MGVLLMILSAPIMAQPAGTTFPAHSAGTPNGATDPKVIELWGLFESVYRSMQKHMQENSGRPVIAAILGQDCAPNWNNEFQVKALLADANDREADKGLSVRGGYTSEDFSDQIDNADDKEGNSYVELSWDILRNGYKDHNAQAKNIRRQAQIQELEGELKQQQLNYRCRRQHSTQQFIGLESSLLLLKLKLMEPVYEVEKKAYFSGWSFLDELLVSEEDIRLARQELEYLYSNPYWQDALSQNFNPPVIDLDFVAVIDAIKQDPRLAKIGNLEKINITEKNQYQEGSQFRLFLRKEFDTGTGDGMVAGARFTVPLTMSDNASTSYQTRQIEQNVSYASWERIAQTRAAYEELHEQFERVVKQQYRYLRSHERLRRIQARQSLDKELELAAVIARMRTFLDAGIELVRAKKELYRRVNEVFLVAQIEYDDRFIKVSPLESNDYRARQGERSIYLWSKGFNTLSNAQLLNLLIAKDIKRVFLSAGKNTQRTKMQQFEIDTARDGIAVERIIGANNWVFPENHLKAAAAVAAAVELNTAIHLDIEPQALPGSKEDKLNNVNNYIELLRKIRDVSSDVPLSVAVPFHWPVESYQSISQLTDKLYIMAYGSDKLSTIIRRVNRILPHVPPSKIAVVLRVDDFENEWALEQAIEAITTATGVTEFAFHHLDTFIQQQGR